jgi:hypothetical protein
MQINFGVTDPGSVQFGDPIIYIIPTEAYKELWDEAGNPVVSDQLAALEDLLADRPDLSTANLPVLPFEACQVMGASNLGIIAHSEYLDIPWGSGVRFVATPMQGVDVILNRNVVYIEQGLTVILHFSAALPAPWPVKSRDWQLARSAPVLVPESGRFSRHAALG